MALRPGEPFGRYRVEALLGEGGMGQVYRARDQHLRRRVALKVISAVAGTDVGARLLREARAAAAIDHPNAIAIFDVGEVDGTPFLAMELVDGVTLRRYVGDASVPISLRLSWLLAVARALAAAHKRGIVHRDIKPENVMVRADGIVKVLDFGIARPVVRPRAPSSPDAPRSERAGASLSVMSANTADSARVGTPLYMSPEQLRGDALDGRSDQFAWGVVAWELLVGRLPWSLEHGGAVAMAEILSKDPDPVTAHVPVGAAAQAVVARALRKRPADRFAGSDDLVAALEAAMGVDPFTPVVPTRGSVSPTAQTVSAGWTQTLRTRRSLTLGVALAVAIAAGVGIWRARAPRPTDDLALSLVTNGRRPAVAVLGVGTQGNADARLAAIPELLATELASGDQIRVVPRDVTDRTAGPEASSARPTPQLLAKLRDVADADYVLVASPELRGGDSVHIRVQVLSVPRAAATSRASEVAVDGSTKDLAAVASRAGEQVRRLLGRPPLAPEEVAALRAALPKTTAAAEAYAQGLTCRARYDASGAREAFERAVAAEGDFALAHLELSRALTMLGFDQLAQAEASRALELSGALGREQRLVITAQHAVAAKDWATATDTYRTLFDFFPDNLDYGLAYARAQVYLGKRNDAFATLDRLRSVPRTAMDEARLYLLEALIAAKVGDVRRRLASSLEAKSRADALGATWISAEARMGITEAYYNLGQINRGRQDLDEAQALYAQLGDRSGLAGVYRGRADLAEAASDYPTALEMVNRALVLAKQVGDRYRTGGLVTHKGIVLGDVGRFREAIACFEEARTLYESIQDIEGQAHNWGNAAELRLESGDMTNVRADFERALAMHRQIGMKVGIMEQVRNVGRAAFYEGDVDEGGRMLADALAQARASGHEENTREALVNIAEWALARDDAKTAAINLEEAATSAEKADEPDFGAEVRLDQANLELDEPGAGSGEPRVRAALGRFVAAKLPHEEALARALLVRALVRKGALEDAAREVDALDRSLEGCELFDARLQAGFAHAELAAARGDHGAALQAASAARASAESTHVVPWTLEARLVEARCQTGAARAPAMTNLAHDAKAAGFLRVARLAGGR